MNFRIDFNGGENRWITEGSINLAREDWLQVDFFYTAVIKADPESIATQKVNCGHTVDRMAHTASSTQGFNSIRRAALLQAFPIRHELLSVYLCPSFDKTLLRARKRACYQLD
jgi:hypothetical protein